MNQEIKPGDVLIHRMQGFKVTVAEVCPVHFNAHSWRPEVSVKLDNGLTIDSTPYRVMS